MMNIEIQHLTCKCYIMQFFIYKVVFPSFQK